MRAGQRLDLVGSSLQSLDNEMAQCCRGAKPLDNTAAISLSRTYTVGQVKTISLPINTIYVCSLVNFHISQQFNAKVKATTQYFELN